MVQPVTFKVEIEGPNGTVIFQSSVPVGESRAASYDPYGIVHLPTSLLAYRNTAGRRFTIQGRLVSRTPDEAGANARYLNHIRSWLLPDYAASGATPPIVKLSAYANDNIKKVQCVILSYSVGFPDDVDYIYTSNPPMPVIASVNVEMEEIYSAEQIAAGAWSISNEAEGSFAGGQDDQAELAKQLTTITSTSGFKGFPGIANRQVATPGSTLGTITGALLGKKLFGNNAGAAAGALLGSRLGQKFPSLNSGSLTDSTKTSSPLNNNVFITGVSPSFVAQANSSTTDAALRAQVGPQETFNRTNPSPPDLADFYG